MMIHQCHIGIEFTVKLYSFLAGRRLPANCLSDCVAIRVPIPERNNGWSSTERIRIIWAARVIPVSAFQT